MGGGCGHSLRPIKLNLVLQTPLGANFDREGASLEGKGLFLLFIIGGRRGCGHRFSI